MDEKLLRPNRQHRWGKILLASATVGALCWWSGVTAILPRIFAERAIRTHNLDEAEQWIRFALRVSHDSADDYFVLARIQRKQGNPESFNESLQQAVKLGLNSRFADNERLLAQAQSGQLDAILSRLDRLLISGEADGQEVLEAYVNGCLAAARLVQAEALIIAWADSFPEDGQPDYYRGRLRRFYGRNSKAAEAFSSVLAREPKHYPAAYLLGQILMEENRPEEALEQFRLASNMVFSAAPRIAFAKSLRSLGRVDQARVVLEEVVKVSPDDTLKSFHRVGDRFEGTPAQLELGNLELAVGNSEQAVKWLDIAVAACPGDLSARHARGIALRGAGRSAEASSELQAVKSARLALREVDQLADLVDKDPTLVDERVRIGELYITHESKKTGEYWLKSALARNPAHQRAHELLTELYLDLSKTEAGYAQLAERHQGQSERSAATADSSQAKNSEP